MSVWGPVCREWRPGNGPRPTWQGLLSGAPRKNGWPLAEAHGDAGAGGRPPLVSRQRLRNGEAGSRPGRL